MVVDRYFNEFEAKGEVKVRQELELGIYGEPRAKFARNWLSERELASSEARNSEQIELARAAVEAARDANQIARQARLIGITAMIISAIVAILF